MRHNTALFKGTPVTRSRADSAETRGMKRHVIRGINGVYYDDLCKAHDRSHIITRRCIDNPASALIVRIRESLRVNTNICPTSRGGVHNQLIFYRNRINRNFIEI